MFEQGGYAQAICRQGVLQPLEVCFCARLPGAFGKQGRQTGGGNKGSARLHLQRQLRVVRAVVAHQLRDGFVAVETADRRGAEQVAVAGIAAQECPDAQPQIIQAVPGLVAGLDKAAAQFQPLLEVRLHGRSEGKQRVGIQCGHATLFNQRAGIPEPVGAGNFQLLRVPEHQLQIAAVEAVDVPGQSRALAHGAEAQFPQAPDLAHHAGRVGHAAQMDLLAIRGQAQRLAGIDFLA